MSNQETADNKRLAVGVYMLTRDVTNPHPDKRERVDWRKQPVWKKGTTYVCVPEVPGSDRLEVRDIRGWLHQALGAQLTGCDPKRAAQCEALFPALERQHGVEADFTYFMATHGNEGTVRSHASRLLFAALTEGKIDMAWLDATNERLFGKEEVDADDS